MEIISEKNAKKFNNYDIMLKYLSKARNIKEASFLYDENGGIWILNIIELIK